jgi:hypothetical protein
VNPYLWLAGLILIICTHGAAYWNGHSDGVDGERKTQQVEVEAWRQNANAAAELYEEEKTKKAPQIRTIYKTKEVVRAANPDFSSCHAGDSGLRVLNDRIDLLNTGLTAPGVPAAGQASR